MQTWNSVCGADGNPNNRKLEGSDQLVPRCTCWRWRTLRAPPLQVAFAILFCQSQPLKGGSWGGEKANPDVREETNGGLLLRKLGEISTEISCQARARHVPGTRKCIACMPLEVPGT